MHIGRAQPLPPDRSQVLATLDLTANAPIVIAHDSTPTGAGSKSPVPTYHPVADLIQRQSQVADAIAHAIAPSSGARREAYGGTPPAPSILDLRA